MHERSSCSFPGRLYEGVANLPSDVVRIEKSANNVFFGRINQDEVRRDVFLSIEFATSVHPSH